MNKFFKPKHIDERKLQYEKELETKCQEKFGISIGRLKSIYFSFYAKMDEPERSQAKNNFDIKYPLQYSVIGFPKTISYAIYFGFGWYNASEEWDYWMKIYNKYEKKFNMKKELNEKLQSTYFAFYDQLPEPYKTQAKNNFDIEVAINYVIPKTIIEAVINGFSWGKVPEKSDYWQKLLITIIRKK